MSDKSSSSLISYLFFVIITIIYSNFNYFFGKRKKDTAPEKSKDTNIFFAIYILILVIGQFSINLTSTKSICGSNQWATALSMTLIPWVIIFGSIYVILKVFPGWLFPFSSTFGYLLSKLFYNIKVEENTTATNQQKVLFDRFYDDPGLILNRLTIENFKDTYKKVVNAGLINKDIKEFQVYNFVYFKTIIAETMWYIFTGCFIIAVSTNYLVNSACKISAAEMQKKTDEYHKAQEKLKNDKKSSEPKVYSSSE